MATIMLVSFCCLFVVYLTVYGMVLRYGFGNPIGSIFLSFKSQVQTQYSPKNATIIVACMVITVILFNLAFMILLLQNIWWLMTNVVKISIALLTLSSSCIFWFMVLRKMQNIRAFAGFGILITGSILCGLGWVIAPSWITIDIGYVMLLYLCIGCIRAIPVRYVTIAFVLLIAYDIWGVFHSKVIVEAAENAVQTLPMLFLVPYNPFDLHSMLIGAIGSGDILVSVVFLLKAREFGIEKYVMAGFIASISLMIAASVYFNTPIPALLFIVPMAVMSYVIGSLWKHKRIFVY